MKKLLKFIRMIPFILDILDEILDYLQKNEIISEIDNKRLTKKIKK